jgi:aminopeptidase N
MDRSLATPPVAAPQVINRADYQPPAFKVRHLALDFTLEPHATIVKARLDIARAGADSWNCCRSRSMGVCWVRAITGGMTSI